MEEPLNFLQQDYLKAMQLGSGRLADKVIEKALDSNISAKQIYLQIFQNTAYEIGNLWQYNKFSVAQEHLATAIIERQMGDLRPYFKPQRKRARKLVLGAVNAELHKVGVRMVADFFEQDGWDVYYLGATVPTSTFISIAREFQADLIGVSAQMIYHLPEIRSFVNQIDQQGMSGIPIMAGGFPFVQNPDLYKKLGVHFSGVDAEEALNRANVLAK